MDVRHSASCIGSLRSLYTLPYITFFPRIFRLYSVFNFERKTKTTDVHGPDSWGLGTPVSSPVCFMCCEQAIIMYTRLTASFPGQLGSRRANLDPMTRWPFVWDVTVVSPLAASYVDRAATDAGTVADMAATRKTEKYSTLTSAYWFEPIAVKNLGVFSSTTLNFISELGRRICVHAGDARETLYLFQFPTHFYHATPLQLRAFARRSTS